MPTPAAGVGDSPQSQVCFSDTWIPAVSQALTLLVRPEAWAGDLAAVRLAVLDAQELLGSISPCFPLPNWEANLAVGPCGQPISLDATMWSIYTCEGLGCQRAYAGFATQPPFGGAGFYLTGVSFADCDTGSPVGGEVCELSIFQIGSVIGNIWTFRWHDCLNVAHVDTVPGSSFYKANFPAKDMCISALSPFAFSLSIKGKWLCGPA